MRLILARIVLDFEIHLHFEPPSVLQGCPVAIEAMLAVKVGVVKLAKESALFLGMF